MSTMTEAAFTAVSGLRQHNRLLRLSFPNEDGPSAFMLANRLEASEALSRDFEFDVEVISNDPGIALKDVQGKMVTVELVREDGTLRYFNGYVFEFRRVRADGGQVFYAMKLLPWLAYLRLRRDNYLFHDKTLREQTDEIFADYKLRASDIRVRGADPAMTDACQYGETDYNYLHRRWEQKGWCYWYEHTASGHTLILSDDSTQAAPIDGERTDIPFQRAAGAKEDDALGEWTPVRRLVPSKVALASFDFRKPRPEKVDLPTTNEQGDVLPMEVYEYVGAYGFKDSADGDAQIRLRLEEIEASGKHFEGAGNDRSAQPGRWFELSGHFDEGDGPDALNFLILEVRHSVTNNYQMGAEALSQYENRMTCIRKQIPWRPGRGYNSTEPKIYGLQTAIVVGPAGEEIHTDEFGRVRVQFHWDREGKYDEKSSAWLRVATPWSGSSFGMTSIPRIGTEVIVQFLDGNPDRPMITAMVPNMETMPPWSLPASKTQSGILSRSTPGGSYENANAIRFDDKKGSEQLWIHAESNLDTEVENDENHSVSHNRSKFVGNDETKRVKNVLMETVKADALQQVGGDKNTLVGKHYKIEAGDTFEITCGEAKFYMDKSGNVAITGKSINITSDGPVQMNGKMIDLNPSGGGAAVTPSPKGGGAIIADVDAQFASDDK